MVWLFERDHEVARVETRFDKNIDAYVLRIVWAHGMESTERFADTAAFDARMQLLERQLTESRWVQQGGPTLQPDGWRGP